MMKMARLAMNPEFRNGVQRVAEELKKAGIDMSSPVSPHSQYDLGRRVIEDIQEIMNELMSLQKAAK